MNQHQPSNEDYLHKHFLNDLLAQLSPLPKKMKSAIAEHYTKQYTLAMAENESPEDVLLLFGSPSWLAQEILEEYRLLYPPTKKYQDKGRTLLAFLFLFTAFGALIYTVVAFLPLILDLTITPWMRLYSGVLNTLIMGKGGGVLQIQLGGLLFFGGFSLLFFGILLYLLKTAGQVVNQISDHLLDPEKKGWFAIKPLSSFWVVLFFIAFTFIAIGTVMMITAYQKGGYITPFMPAPGLPYI